MTRGLRAPSDQPIVTPLRSKQDIRLCSDREQSFSARACMRLATAENHIPRPGMLATVRNRRGTVAAVDPFDGEAGRVHLVHIEYQDHGSPTDGE